MKLVCSSIRIRDLTLNQSTSSKYVILMMVKLAVENEQHTALVLKNDTVYVKVLLRLHLIWKWKPNFNDLCGCMRFTERSKAMKFFQGFSTYQVTKC
jgi:hypothetical protein